MFGLYAQLDMGKEMFYKEMIKNLFLDLIDVPKNRKNGLNENKTRLLYLNWPRKEVRSSYLVYKYNSAWVERCSKNK